MINTVSKTLKRKADLAIVVPKPIIAKKMSGNRRITSLFSMAASFTFSFWPTITIVSVNLSLLL